MSYERHLFWKCSKFNADSKNAEKNGEKTFCFWDKCIWVVCSHLSLLIREYLSQAVTLLRKGWRIFMFLRVIFATQLPSKWSLKMIKALWFRLNQFFTPFVMSSLQRSSQAGVSRHLSKPVFRGQYFRKYISYEGHLFLKMFES